ncbi:hypothetical protein Nepgr_026943 [Nepenthes gracilis]|uniref:Uncharacterized protein n=1 Tax=Nepenthes gracilis TaxID=150966 RepID=A0AAD3T7R5_NEPGR|nr:hypothetical protein Nepgr_026943 [Nepenthes gracilis]
MRKAELLFFPMPGISHLVPAVEISKLLVQRDETISVTHLVVKLPHDNQTSLYMESVEAGLNRRIELLVLPSLENPVDRSSRSFIELLVEGYKPIVKQIVLDRADGNPGLVVDFFCTGMIDLANEMNVPSYLFFTSAISTLALFLHFQSLRDNHGIDVTQFDNDPDAELDLPVFGNRFPAKLLPQVTLDRSEEGGSNALLNQVKRYRKTKGMIVNSFAELEPRAVRWLSSDATIPPIYPLGPVISFTRKSGGAADGDGVSILRWLDDQPLSSVVFICFGSTGSFREEQVREIAEALERSGLRFLWSLRATPDDLSFEDVLPDGFLGRTAETRESYRVGPAGGDPIPRRRRRLHVALWVELDSGERMVRDASWGMASFCRTTAECFYAGDGIGNRRRH